MYTFKCVTTPARESNWERKLEVWGGGGLVAKAMANWGVVVSGHERKQR